MELWTVTYLLTIFQIHEFYSVLKPLSLNIRNSHLTNACSWNTKILSRHLVPKIMCHLPNFYFLKFLTLSHRVNLWAPKHVIKVFKHHYKPVAFLFTNALILLIPILHQYIHLFASKKDWNSNGNTLWAPTPCNFLIMLVIIYCAGSPPHFEFNFKFSIFRCR